MTGSCGLAHSLPWRAALAALAQSPAQCAAERRATSPSATSASRVCSASPKARSTTICRSTSAITLNAAARARSDARAVRHRLLPRRAAAPRRQHAGRRGARAPVHRELRDHGQQGHQDRGPAEVAAQRRPRRRQDLRPLGARGREAVPDGPVLQPRQVRRARRHQRRGAARQPRQGQDRHQGRQARQDPPDQHRRQRDVQATRRSSTTSS